MLHQLFDIEGLPALLTGCVSLITALLLVATQHLHGHLSMDSNAGVQRTHTIPTPRIGGVAIVGGLVVGFVLANPAQQRLLGPLMLAGLPAFAFGLLEDVTKCVSVRNRLLATMASGLVGWFITGHSITDANMPGLDWILSFTLASVLFTAFAVGGVANAVNIIDGFHGLASGTVIIILTALGFMSSSLGDHDLAMVCLILAGSVAGFLLVNWPLGKIFLGDGGAYFSGFAIAWLAVLLLARHAEVSAWAPLLVCGFPILEVMFSIYRRRKRNINPGHPDRLHLHSLVRRRFVSRILPKATNQIRNAATGALMWIAALVPAAIALQSPTDTFMLIAGFLLCCILYSALYARLTQFRWCFAAATLAVKPA